VSKFWSKHVHQLHPYVPGEQPKIANLVKLNTNESPYGPSPKVIEVLRAELDGRGDDLRLYPDPTSQALVATIAEYFDLENSQVFVGNGSDEVLAHAFNAFFKQDKDRPLLFPEISYSFYPVYCGLYNVDYRVVPLAEDFSINVADYSQAGGVIIPNPNAPTGILLSLSEIESLLQANADCVVIIDEAYVDFGGESAASLINQYDNLLVVQTLSKSRALAGMRVGFALGHPDLIEALVRVKDSFNSYPIDRLAQLAAIAAFQDEAYFKASCEAVVRDRELLVAELQVRGFSVLPSSANFVFATHAQVPAIDIAAVLRQQGVIVRHFNKPRIDNFLRITIGTPEQNQALLSALDHLSA
jgi:histidinol-phosphate aminotransferase